MITFEEDRKEQRFTFVRGLDATLGRVPLELCSIAESGVGVRHKTPLRLGSEAPLRISLPELLIKVQVVAVVVWSRLASPGELQPYHSGLRIPDPDGTLHHAVETLREQGMLLSDNTPIHRHKTDAEALRPALPGRNGRARSLHHYPPSIVHIVKEARTRLLASPSELAHWRDRARLALAESGEPHATRDEVLAVWQYLERSLELDTVAKLLEE